MACLGLLLVCLMSSEQPRDDLDGNVHGARPPHDQPRQAGPHPLRQELRRHHHQRSARNCLQSLWVKGQDSIYCCSCLWCCWSSSFIYFSTSAASQRSTHSNWEQSQVPYLRSFLVYVSNLEFRFRSRNLGDKVLYASEIGKLLPFLMRQMLLAVLSYCYVKKKVGSCEIFLKHRRKFAEECTERLKLLSECKKNIWNWSPFRVPWERTVFSQPSMTR